MLSSRDWPARDLLQYRFRGDPARRSAIRRSRFRRPGGAAARVVRSAPAGFPADRPNASTPTIHTRTLQGAARCTRAEARRRRDCAETEWLLVKNTWPDRREPPRL